MLSRWTVVVVNATPCLSLRCCLRSDILWHLKSQWWQWHVPVYSSFSSGCCLFMCRFKLALREKTNKHNLHWWFLFSPGTLQFSSLGSLELMESSDFFSWSGTSLSCLLLSESWLAGIWWPLSLSARPLDWMPLARFSWQWSLFTKVLVLSSIPETLTWASSFDSSLTSSSGFSWSLTNLGTWFAATRWPLSCLHKLGNHWNGCP